MTGAIFGSIFLIAAGAILRYALNVTVQDVDLDVVGLILMIAGAATLVLSIVYSLASPGGGSPGRDYR